MEEELAKKELMAAANEYVVDTRAAKAAASSAVPALAL